MQETWETITPRTDQYKVRDSAWSEIWINVEPPPTVPKAESDSDRYLHINVVYLCSKQILLCVEQNLTSSLFNVDNYAACGFLEPSSTLQRAHKLLPTTQATTNYAG